MLSNIISIFSDITCGEACWHAREPICRCSCGGKNHGCLTVAGGGEQPLRTCRIGGVRYELHSVGFMRDLYEPAWLINSSEGWRSIDGRAHAYHYSWKETDDGSPARLKTASKAALKSWPELRGFADHPEV